jgi:hypothetical protein
MMNQKNSAQSETNSGSGNDTIVQVYVCEIFCFHEKTIINVLENDNKIKKRQVSHIKKDDRVLTYDGGKKILTKVIKNVENKGPFEFYEFKCRNKNKDLYTKSITVTGNHTMLIYSKDDNKIQFKSADRTKIGDLFRTTDGMYEIFEINKKRMNRSYELRVENGTVLANDILVSTLYLGNNENVKQYNKIIELSKIPVEILN